MNFFLRGCCAVLLFFIAQKLSAQLVVSSAVSFSEKPISLHFENAELRTVFHVFADFTGLNVIVSDHVAGQVTIHLQNVPWEEALKAILQSKGLSRRRMGNILFIGSIEEIALYEKKTLEASEEARNLVPLRSVVIPLKHAKAQEVAALLKGDKNSLLSQRGSVSLDARTNALLIQESFEKIEELKKVVAGLDIAVRQVLIEARMVVVNEHFEEALGLRFGAHWDQRYMPKTAAGLERLNIDVPSNAPAGKAYLGRMIGRLPKGILLDVELAALESEGFGKVIARPRLITANQQKAFIESGEEIPYQESAYNGATTVAFKKAALRLEVEPRITSDLGVVLDLRVNQDSKGEMINNVPAINTQQLQTGVLLKNGETVVLGGIYRQQKQKNISRVPVLWRLPLLGRFFRNEYTSLVRYELMIFVTPTILSDPSW